MVFILFMQVLKKVLKCLKCEFKNPEDILFLYITICVCFKLKCKYIWCWSRSWEEGICVYFSWSNLPVCVWKRSVSLMRKTVLIMMWPVRKSRRKRSVITQMPRRSIRERQSEGSTMRTVPIQFFVFLLNQLILYSWMHRLIMTLCQVLLMHSPNCTPVLTVPVVTSVTRHWRSTLNYGMKRARTTTAAPSVATPSPTARSSSVTWPHTDTFESRYSRELAPSWCSHLCRGNDTELLFTVTCWLKLLWRSKLFPVSFLSGLFLSQAETESLSVQNAPRPSNTNITWRSTCASTAVSCQPWHNFTEMILL